MTSTPPEKKTESNQQSSVQEIRSEELFRGKKQLVILHQGEHYRLTITRNDKLILQK